MDISKRIFYVGSTSCLIKRINEHNSPFNKGFTKTRQWKCVYFEGYVHKEYALKREKVLKHNRKSWKFVRERILTSLADY